VNGSTSSTNGSVSSKPLAGIRVIELAGIGPAPLACTVLAEMGCDVVRIERISASANSVDSRLSRIGVRRRTTISVDLKTEAGRGVVQSLINSADVLIEAFRPGAAERLGVGPEQFSESNPGLVYVRLTGWGQNGPYSGMAGHDINYIGLVGALGAIGEAGRPIPPLNLLGDYAGGSMYAIVSILAALIERASTKLGATVDAAMIDGVSILMTPIRDLALLGGWVEERSSNMLDGGAPFYRTYETSDGRFMAVGALEPVFYSAFVVGLGLDEADLSNRFDPENWSTLADVFSEVFACDTMDHWRSVFDGTDACVTPVLAMSETADHPQNQARTHGFPDRPVAPDAARKVLSHAGLSDGQIGALVDDGVIALG
jgi:alpha-methylacyl-CoA racemase